MINHAGADHMQVNIHQTAMQVLIGFNSGGMITALPEEGLEPSLGGNPTGF